MSILQSRLKYNKAVSPSATCLGPFPVSAITDYVRGVLVTQQGLPIILQDGARFAVLAPPNKELRIVCAGCFTPGMSLFDDSKCKKVSSYSQHWDTRKGDRKESCKALGFDSLKSCIQRVNAVKDEEVEGVNDNVLDTVEAGSVTTDDLDAAMALRNRGPMSAADIAHLNRVKGLRKEADAVLAVVEAGWKVKGVEVKRADPVDSIFESINDGIEAFGDVITAGVADSNKAAAMVETLSDRIGWLAGLRKEDEEEEEVTVGGEGDTAQRVDKWIAGIRANPPDFLRRSLRGNEHDRTADIKAALPKEQDAVLDDSVVIVRRKGGSFHTAVLEGALNRLVGGQYDVPYTPVVDRVAKLLADKDDLEDKVEELERKLSDLEDSVDLSDLSTRGIVQELERRDALTEAIVRVDTDRLAATAKDRGIKLLVDARFEDLEAEMRRIADPTGPTIDSFYFADKVVGVPHVSDTPLATFESFVKRGDLAMSAGDIAHIKRMREKGGPGPAPKVGKRGSYETRSKQGAKRYKLRGRK
jgi:hypothetical protein